MAVETKKTEDTDVWKGLIRLIIWFKTYLIPIQEYFPKNKKYVERNMRFILLKRADNDDGFQGIPLHPLKISFMIISIDPGNCSFNTCIIQVV